MSSNTQIPNFRRYRVIVKTPEPPIGPSAALSVRNIDHLEFETVTRSMELPAWDRSKPPACCSTQGKRPDWPDGLRDTELACSRLPVIFMTGHGILIPPSRLCEKAHSISLPSHSPPPS